MFVSVVALLRCSVFVFIMIICCCVKSLFLANVKEFYLELFDSKIKIFMVYISFNIIILCYFFLVLFVLLNLKSIVNIIKILIFPFSFSILLCYRIILFGMFLIIIDIICDDLLLYIFHVCYWYEHKKKIIL